jgi:hypothetical protein
MYHISPRVQIVSGRHSLNTGRDQGYGFQNPTLVAAVAKILVSVCSWCGTLLSCRICCLHRCACPVAVGLLRVLWILGFMASRDAVPDDAAWCLSLETRWLLTCAKLLSLRLTHLEDL